MKMISTDLDHSYIQNFPRLRPSEDVLTIEPYYNPALIQDVWMSMPGWEVIQIQIQ